MKRGSNTALIWSNRFRDHRTGAHPERPERIDALESALRAAGMFDDRDVYEPEPVNLDAVEAVHDAALIELVRETAAAGGGWLDPDTYVSAQSYDVALLAAGAACQAVDLIHASHQRAFALIRPPGHHAEPNRAMGFCLFNNIAVAARYAAQHHGIERIAILDWDVHHGNGTQAIFWQDPDVLFVSLHQYPYYPGTGAAGERGAGPGAGTTLNIPLSAGSGDETYLRAFDDQVIPTITEFAPDLLLVSAGFDAHHDDPLAGMRVTTDGFGEMATRALELAERLTDGRIMLVLEGGYNLNALGSSVVETLRRLDGLEYRLQAEEGES